MEAVDLFQRTVPKTSFASVNKLFWGPPKTGKTTLASYLRDGKKEPIFVMTEDGEGTLSILKRKVTSWAGFKALVGKMKDNQAYLVENHSCIVLDLYSELYELRKKAFREEWGQEPADMPHGKGWDLVNSEFREVIRDVLNILPVTLIAHDREKEVTVNGKKKKVQEPWIGGSALIFGNGKVDVIGYVNGETVSFIASSDLIAGSRFPSIRNEYVLDHRDMSTTIAAIEADFNKEEKVT